MWNKQKIQKWIKQVICNHEWRNVGGFCRFTDQAFHVECISEVLECNKCGKRKEVFIRLPGRIA